MRKQKHPRRWFNQKLHRFMWSPTVEPLLNEMRCGWFDGGCYNCAQGLYLYLLASNTLDSANISLRVLSDRRHWAHHVVVSIRTGAQTLYLDANGISSSRRLLRYWEQEECLPGAWIDDYWNAQEVEKVIPLNEKIAQALADQLLTAFGPFSPAWLERSSASGERSSRAE